MLQLVVPLPVSYCVLAVVCVVLLLFVVSETVGLVLVCGYNS